MSDLIIGTSAFANANPQLLKEAGIGYIRADFPVPFADRVGGTLTDHYLRAREEAFAWAGRGFQVIGVTPLPGIGQYKPDAQGVMHMQWTDFFPAWFGSTASDAYFQTYQEVCAFLGQDLRDCVQVWQIANELDIPQFAGPLNLHQAWDLAVHGAIGVKITHPAALVGTNAAGAPASYYFFGRIVQEDRVQMDYCGIDQYYGSWQAGGPDLWVDRIPEIYAATGVKVLVNEWGFASKGEVMSAEERSQGLPNCQFRKWVHSWGEGHTWESQAEFVRQAFDAFVEHRDKLIGICFYRWEDQETCWQCGSPDCPIETAWGLVDKVSCPKPAYYKFKDGVQRLRTA